MFRDSCLTLHGFFVVMGIALVLLFAVLAFLTMTLSEAPPRATEAPTRWGQNAGSNASPESRRGACELVAYSRLGAEAAGTRAFAAEIRQCLEDLQHQR